MGTRTRTVVAMAAAAWLGGASVAHAADTHLRWDDPAIGVAIQDALERSRTFRDLVATVDASDSYVVISVGRCGHGVRACFANVTSAGTGRYMFIRVDPSKRDCELMVSIAHELRHTIEIIEEPSVRGDAEKFFFYQHRGMQMPSRAFETLAAVDAGNQVRSEINSFNRQSQTR